MASGILAAPEHATGTRRSDGLSVRSRWAAEPASRDARARSGRAPRRPQRGPPTRGAFVPGVSRPIVSPERRDREPRGQMASGRARAARREFARISAPHRARGPVSPLRHALVRRLRMRPGEVERPRPRQARGGWPGPRRLIAIGGRLTKADPPPLPCRSGDACPVRMDRGPRTSRVRARRRRAELRASAARRGRAGSRCGPFRSRAAGGAVPSRRPLDARGRGT